MILLKRSYSRIFDIKNSKEIDSSRNCYNSQSQTTQSRNPRAAALRRSYLVVAEKLQIRNIIVLVVNNGGNGIGTVDGDDADATVHL